MGGDSKQTTNTSQSFNSQTNPWAPSQGLLTGILGQLQGQVGKTGITQNETNAIDAYQGMNPQFMDFAKTLLAGGGADAQAGNIKSGYDRYVNQTSPLASNTNYNPYDTPGFRDAINTLTSDITQGVNGQFAAAGRDFSGYNQKTLGRGIMEGVAPVIAQQYNQNVQNQQGAARDLYGAGNTNAGLLTNLSQQALQNRGQGFTTSGDILSNSLNAEGARRGIPAQALGLLANIGVPIAGLGGTSSGVSSGTNTTTNSPSFWQTLGQAGSALGSFGSAGTSLGSAGTSMFGANPNGGVGAFFKFISDRNAKTDIEQVGALFDGTPVYRYRYKGDPRFQIGLMAQDVQQRTPEAVGKIGEYLAVDYKLATDKALEVA